MIKTDKDMETLRTATIEDFKIGTTLITSEGYGFTLIAKYDDGIWEGRGTSGQGVKCIFEHEAKYYKVK